MKTAVLFFGEIRGFADLWRRVYERIVLPNNADVFMHNYYYDADFIERYEDPDIRDALKEYYQNKGLNLYPNQELYDIFSPKAHSLEKRQDFTSANMQTIDKYINKRGDTHANFKGKKYIEMLFNTIMSQHYSRKKVIELKRDFETENGFIYDNVIMTRLDINILGDIKFSSKLACINAKILTPKFSIFEQIISGPSEQMDSIMTMFDNACKYYETYCHDRLDFLTNEFFMHRHLSNCGLLIINYNYPLDYTNSRNGLSRFNKSFITKDDSKDNQQFLHNQPTVTQKIGRWKMFQ
jgi:hypothetical protein